MKKILLFISALAGLFLAASCQQEILDPVAENSQVTFTVEAPAALQTKAIADGLNVDELIYEVWITGATQNQDDLSGATRLYQATTDMVQDGNRMKANITLDLVNDQNFTVLFWAQKKGIDVYNTEWLNAVTYTNLDAEAYAANDNRLDAFYSKAFVIDGVTSTPTVTLRRPFAQVNLCTLNNKEAAQEDGNYNIALVSSKMRLDAVPTVFNVATSAATNYVAMEFMAYNVPSGEDQMITVNGKDYYYAGMNYVFAGANIALTYDIATKLNGTVDANVNNTIANVPLKENHRTNIVGNLLTSKTDFEIIVDAAFDVPEHVIGDEWSQTGDYKYSVNTGASEAALKNILEHADAAAKEAATKSSAPVVTIDLAENVVWKTGAGIGSTPLLPEDSPISAVVINGNGKTFTATGEGVGSVRLANGGLLTFNNVKVVDLSVSYAESSWEYGYLEFAGNLAFNGCEFVNAIMVEGETAAFADCTFNSYDNSQYGVWVNEGVTSFTNCTFAGARGLKVHEAYGSEVASVVVDGCLFTELTKKPGIALGDLNAETSVTIKNSTFDRCQAGDQNNYMYETDTDLTTFAFVCENNVVIPSGDAVVEQEDESLVVSSVEGLKKALASVSNGKTIYLADGTYDGLFLVGTQSFTLKALNAGQAVVAGRVCVAGSQESVFTCEDVHFAVSENTSGAFGNQYYDKTKGYVIGNYSGSIVVKNCKFTGMTDDFGAIFYYSYDEGKATTEKLEKLVVENCQFEGGRAIRSRSNVSVTGCTFKGLINPCLQVLGIGNNDVHSTVVFTGNTSDVATSGVCIKTSNFVTKNITFNVSGNTNCNVISFDSKNLNNLYPETYTFTGEVNTLYAEDSAGLKYLMSKAQAGDTIKLLAGSYKMESYKAGVKIEGVDKATVLVDVQGAKFGVNGNVNIENVTLKFKNDNYMGFQHTGTELYKNCNIEGQPFLYGENVVFDACTFTQTSSDLYNVWTYGAKNVTFNNCTLNSAGKSVLVYAESGNGQVVTFNNTVLNASTPVEGKAAIEVDSSLLGADGLYTININGTTAANGFANGSVSGNPLFNHKKGSKAVFLFDGRTYVAEGVTKDAAGEYYVNSAAGLMHINTMFKNNTAGRGVVMNLAADINFSGYTWTQVDSHVDLGSYISKINGNGYTISNLTINGQAMFRRFAGYGDVVVKDIAFDGAKVNSGDLNTSILTVQTYQNVLLDNVDVKNSTITGTYKVAPLIATVYNEDKSSTITATLKNCDVEKCIVTSTSFDFCTTGMVAFVYEGDNDKVEFENCTVKDVQLKAKPNGYELHAAVYSNSDDVFNEVSGVTVSNVTFEAL